MLGINLLGYNIDYSMKIALEIILKSYNRKSL